MRRRDFISIFGSAAVAWPLAARAEQPTKMSVIACLVGGSKTAAERYFGGFSQGMRELGYARPRLRL
jgi:putative tryptophan/tyrosine transport system substrate-binding protein